MELKVVLGSALGLAGAAAVTMAPGNCEASIRRSALETYMVSVLAPAMLPVKLSWSINAFS